MGRSHFSVLPLLPLLLALAAPTLAQEAPLRVEWEVVNRFRVVLGEAEEKMFADDLRRLAQPGPPAQRTRTLLKEESGRNPPVNNYRTAYDQSRAQYGSDWVHARERTVRMTAAPGGPGPWRCEWPSNARPAAPGACVAELTLRLSSDGDGRRLATAGIDVRATAANGDARRARVRIDIRDVVVVSIGDSFASGEGNPHLNGRSDRNERSGEWALANRTALWWDQRCHRSLISGPVLAAWDLALYNKNTSVTLLAYACSGGEVNQGLIKAWPGQQSRDVALAENNRFMNPDVASANSPFEGELVPPQIHQAIAALCMAGLSTANAGPPSCPPENYRRPDYLLISTGGNEAQFARLVFDLVKSQSDATRRRLERQLDDDLTTLPQEIESLVREVTGNLVPRRVVASLYPDPIRNTSGTPCGSGKGEASFFGFALGWITTPLGVGVFQENSRFAAEVVLPRLNKALLDAYISAVAQVGSTSSGPRIDWRYATGLADASKTHGVCATNRWFNSFADARLRQDTVLGQIASAGTMHPNLGGHFLYKEHIGRQMQGFP